MPAAWEVESLGPACCDVPLQAPSRAVVHELGKLGHSSLWQELHSLLASLRGAVFLTPESEHQLQESISDTQELAQAAERELAAVASSPAGAERNGALLFQGQRWLQQLQDFLVALTHDVEQARNALDARLSHALQEWRLTIKTAVAKLEHSMYASAPTASTGVQTTSQPIHASEAKRDPFAHQQPHHQALDSHDSSCSSSVCGSVSCTTSSSCSVGGGTTGTLSSSSTRSGARLVAARSKLTYGAHWAGKVAL